MRPFDKAKLYTSRLVYEAMNSESEEFSRDIMTCVSRFMRMDWGDTMVEDIAVNIDALKYKDRVLAVYETIKGKVFVIAESEDGVDYTNLVIMFPQEY